MRPILLIALLAATSGVTAQQPSPVRPPAPPGQDIVVRDGDRVIIEDDARIQIVRRRAATVRTIFNSAERWLVMLVDYANPGEFPDGNVDVAYRYTEVHGEWPVGERWEGLTTLEEYHHGASPAPGRGIGVVTPSGLIQLIPSAGPADLRPALEERAAAVLTFRGGGSSGIGRTPPVGFDQAEREHVAQIANNVALRSPSATLTVGRSQPTAAPSRMGGTAATPRKIRDVVPVYPPRARAAGVRGVVLLEVTIATDGSVTNPRVLRSVPLLDQAAIDAVRQWQYEPVVVNGAPIPVVMTVSVPVYPN